MVDTKKLIDEIVEGFIEKWGELNPDVNHGIEFAVEYLQKQQGQPDEELVEKILDAIDNQDCLDIGFSHTQEGREWPELNREKASKRIRTLLQAIPRGTEEELGALDSLVRLEGKYFTTEEVELFKSIHKKLSPESKGEKK